MAEARDVSEVHKTEKMVRESWQISSAQGQAASVLRKKQLVMQEAGGLLTSDVLEGWSRSRYTWGQPSLPLARMVEEGCAFGEAAALCNQG